MNDVTQLLAKTKDGFNRLDVSGKYKDSAIKWLEVWLTDVEFKDYAPQIRHLIEKENWDFLLDSFYQIIPFGTGGRRGLVGIGPRMLALCAPSRDGFRRQPR